jgi:hypothetical protein
LDLSTFILDVGETGVDQKGVYKLSIDENIQASLISKTLNVLVGSSTSFILSVDVMSDDETSNNNRCFIDRRFIKRRFIKIRFIKRRLIDRRFIDRQCIKKRFIDILFVDQMSVGEKVKARVASFQRLLKNWAEKCRWR